MEQNTILTDGLSDKISIIVPVYNVEKYLKRCIVSIQNQTYSNFELILVDDGSTDSSADICKTICSNDDRIRYIYQENKGPAEARNTGLSLAEGDYILFVDADDYISNTMVETLLKNVIANNADVSVCTCTWGTDSQYEFYCSEHEDLSVYSGRDYTKKLLIDNYSKAWTLWLYLFKKELFSSITIPSQRIYEDIGVIYQLCYISDYVVDCSQILYYHFGNSDSITNYKYSATIAQYETKAYKDMALFFDSKRDAELLEYADIKYMDILASVYHKLASTSPQDEYLNLLRKELAQQMKKNKQNYHIKLKNHPEALNVLYPVWSKLFWTIQGVKSKLKR